MEVASLCALMICVFPLSKFKVAWSVFLSILLSQRTEKINNNNSRYLNFVVNKWGNSALPFDDGFMELNHGADFFEHFKDIL